MTGDKNCFSLFSTKGNLCWNGVTVRGGVARIKEFHSLKVYLTALERHAHKCIQVLARAA